MSKKFLHGLFGFLAGLAVFSLVVFAAPVLSDPGESSSALEVNGIHLTWAENDVYHTMAVSWWTKGPAKSVVLYDTEAHKGASGKYAFKAEGDKHKITTTRSTWDNWYHDVGLTGLEPGTTYYFVCGGPQNWSDEYSFRTIGEDQKVKLVYGGDSRIVPYPGAEIEGPLDYTRIIVSDDAAAENPDFVLFNGDMVWHGFEEEQWERWFDDVTGHLVTDEGRIIPLVPTIGNHDLAYLAWYGDEGEGSWMDMTDYDCYRGLFALPGNELWYTLDFPNIRLIILCAAGGTGFSEKPEPEEEAPFGGMSGAYALRVVNEALAQVDFLEEQLAGAEQRWTLTTQHTSITGGYGLRPGDGGEGMIYHWVPLFEEYGMPMNLASHSHHYVRTWPIAHLELPEDFTDFGESAQDLWPNGQPIVELAHNSEDGVIYEVQGNWGAACEWMEKDTSVRIYPWFAAARSRPTYTLIEDEGEGLHVTTKHAGVVWSWYGIPKELDEFTLPFTTADFPTAEYTVAF